MNEKPEHKIPPPLRVPVPPMAEDRFWSLIDASRRRASEKKLSRGQDFIDVHMVEHSTTLRGLEPEELIAYSNRFQYYSRLSYRWDLWAVAYWLQGGCS